MKENKRVGIGPYVLIYSIGFYSGHVSKSYMALFYSLIVIFVLEVMIYVGGKLLVKYDIKLWPRKN